MVIASVLALLLAAQAADDAPISTSPAARPAPQPAAPPGPAQSGAREPGRAADIPASAPTDDYGFVAWCHGALSGHMELYERVKPELDKVSPGQDDKPMNQAGREYLALYAKALKAAEAASPTNIHNRGVQANAAGYRIWAAARTAEPRTQMWSYLMWELPPRCEIAAKRLEERSTLFGQALRPTGPEQPGPESEAGQTPIAADDAPLLRGPQ